MQIMVGLIVLLNFIAMFCTFSAIKGSSGTYQSLTTLMNPLIIAMWIYVLFGEKTFNTYSIIAAAFMLIGAIILITKG